MSDKRDDQEEMTVLAGEYAAGLLVGGDLDAAHRRVTVDREFAREVARWRGRLAGLQEQVADVPPPSALWTRIEASLARLPAANDNMLALRKKLTVWRSAAAGMTAIAAALALVLLLQPRQPVAPAPPVQQATAQPMVALVGDKGAAKLVVSWDPSSKQMVLAVAGGLSGDAAHSHELWVIPADGTPRSLGVLAGPQSHKRLADALAVLLRQGATIAISVEPRGGSRTGAPTGPVIASGSLTPA